MPKIKNWSKEDTRSSLSEHHLSIWSNGNYGIILVGNQRDWLVILRDIPNDNTLFREEFNDRDKAYKYTVEFMKTHPIKEYPLKA